MQYMYTVYTVHDIRPAPILASSHSTCFGFQEF